MGEKEGEEERDEQGAGERGNISGGKPVAVESMKEARAKR